MNRTLSSANVKTNQDNSVKRLFISLFCLLFLFSGPLWAWADCFRHNHVGVEEHHHGGARELLISDVGDTDHDDSGPRFHCPELRFDTESLNSLSTRPMPKPQDHEYKLASHSDLSKEQIFLSVQSDSTNHVRRFPSHPFLMSVSPYLLLSVFRI